MMNVIQTVKNRIPSRSFSAARGAAIGAAVGALFGRKAALLFGGLGSYFGTIVGENKESRTVKSEEEQPEV